MKTNKLAALFRPVLLALLLIPLAGCSDSDDWNPADKYTAETDTDELRFPAEGGTLSLTLTTNAAWQIHTPSDVMTYTPAAGDTPAAGTVIRVTMPPRDETEFNELETTLTIRAGELAADRVHRTFIKVYQDGHEKPERLPGIWSASDWTAFAAAVNNAGETGPDLSEWEVDGIINLRADIDFGAVRIPGVGGTTSNNAIGTGDDAAFQGEFNGNGFTVKGELDGTSAQIIALFRRLGPEGIIRNLNADVTGTSTYTGSNGHLAGIVGFSLASTGSYIENCTVRGKLTHAEGAATNTRVGGIVGYGRCPITGCSNYADIVSHSNRVAGISGAGGGTNTISGCTNYGNITVNAAGTQTGGIIGQLNGQTITNCVNEGNITAVANAATTVGGIAGDARGSAAITIGGADGGQTVNKGTIKLTGAAGVTPNGAAAGGIAGNINVANVTVENCENRGDILSEADHASVSAGGIAGKTANAATLTSCTNAAGTTVSAATQAGGIVGVSTGAAKINGGGNQGAIATLTGATISEKGTFIGGIIGKKGTAVLTGNSYGGTVLGAPGTAANAEGN